MRPGLKMPAGSKLCASRSWMRRCAAEIGPNWLPALAGPALPAMKREALPPTCAAAACSAAACSRPACTQRRAPCHSISGGAAQAAPARAPWQAATGAIRPAPAAARGAANQGLLLAAGGPVGSGSGIVQAITAQAVAGRTAAAAPAHVQRARALSRWCWCCCQPACRPAPSNWR